MSTIHCSRDSGAPISDRMAGIATFTIVASIDEISRLRQQVTSTIVL